MFKIALRNVAAHKVRLLLTVLTVTLSVAFVAGTLVFSDTVSRGYQNQSAQNFTGVDVGVRATGTARRADLAPGLTRPLLDRIRALPGVADARGQVTGPTYVISRAGHVVGHPSLGADFAPGVDGRDPDHRIVEGRVPRGPGEVALDTRTAVRADAVVGGTVRLVVDGPVLRERLVGTFTTTDPAVSAGATLALFDQTTAQRLFGTPGQYDQITVRAAAGTDERQLGAEIRPLLGRNAEVVPKARLISDQRAVNAASFRALSQVFVAFALLSLFVGIFLIANTFTVLVAQRAREFALLRALGASRRQVARSVQVEALVVGLLSSAAGLVLGVLAGGELRAVLNGLLDAGLPDARPVVAPGTVVGSLLAGTLVTLLAAWLPGRRAARTAPVEAMNSVHVPPGQAGLRLRNALGFAVAAFSGALIVLGVLAGGTGGGYLVGAGGAVLVVALVILTPLLTKPVLGLVERPLTRRFGVDGKLAVENVRRNPRRTASTTAALLLGSFLVTTISVIGTSMGSVLAQHTTASLNAQYAVSTVTGLPLDASVAHTIAAIPGVEVATPVRNGEVASVGRATGYPVSAVDPARIADVLSLDFTAGDARGLDSGLLLTDAAAERAHAGVGDRVTVTFADRQRQSLVVRGVFRNSPLLSEYVLSLHTLAQHTADRRDDRILVRAEPRQAAALPDRIAAALGHNPLIKVQTHHDLRKEIAGTISLLLNLIYGLLGMALIISALGVVNTMALAVLERTQEIGMLRAVGQQRGGVRRMIWLESLLIALFGGVLGMVVGTFVAWVMGTVVFAGSKVLYGYTTHIPWDRLAIFLAATVLVGMLAALWPARRAARLDVLHAIQTQ